VHLVTEYVEVAEEDEYESGLPLPSVAQDRFAETGCSVLVESELIRGFIYEKHVSP